MVSAAADPNRRLTVGEIAEACEVSLRKAATWIDDGILEGYKLPGSNHRRATLSNVVEFMRQNGFPQRMIQRLTGE